MRLVVCVGELGGVGARRVLIVEFSTVNSITVAMPIVCSLTGRCPRMEVAILDHSFTHPFFRGLTPGINFVRTSLGKRCGNMGNLGTLCHQLVTGRFATVTSLRDILHSDCLHVHFGLSGFGITRVSGRHGKGHGLITSSNGIVRGRPSSFRGCTSIFTGLNCPMRVSFASLFPRRKKSLDLLPRRIFRIAISGGGSGSAIVGGSTRGPTRP